MRQDESYEPGDWVVMRVNKRSPHPGPRAEEVEPEPMGEGYQYKVDKYWTVADVLPEGAVVVRTRRGKRRVIHTGNPALRHANLWERLTLRSRFPAGIRSWLRFCRPTRIPPNRGCRTRRG